MPECQGLKVKRAVFVILAPGAEGWLLRTHGSQRLYVLPLTHTSVYITCMFLPEVFKHCFVSRWVVLNRAKPGMKTFSAPSTKCLGHVNACHQLQR